MYGNFSIAFGSNKPQYSLARQAVLGFRVVWTGKPTGGLVRKAFGQTGSRNLKAERFRRRQDVPARVRCKDSASEHLTPPFICLAQAMPCRKNGKGPISLQIFSELAPGEWLRPHDHPARGTRKARHIVGRPGPHRSRKQRQ